MIIFFRALVERRALVPLEIALVKPSHRATSSVVVHKRVDEDAAAAVCVHKGGHGPVYKTQTDPNAVMRSLAPIPIPRPPGGARGFTWAGNVRSGASSCFPQLFLRPSHPVNLAFRPTGSGRVGRYCKQRVMGKKLCWRELPEISRTSRCISAYLCLCVS